MRVCRICIYLPDAVQLTCTGGGSAEETLRPVIDALFTTTAAEDRPRLLYSCTFNQPAAPGDTHVPAGVAVIGGCDGDVDCDAVVAMARAAFDELCPGEGVCWLYTTSPCTRTRTRPLTFNALWPAAEWLPPSPEPEDIVWEDDAIRSDAPVGLEQAAPDAQSDATEPTA
jgi:hypothetical protein